MYAFRYGKAIVVSPLINAVAPAITVLLSLLIYRTVPHRIVALGMPLRRSRSSSRRKARMVQHVDQL